MSVESTTRPSGSASRRGPRAPPGCAADNSPASRRRVQVRARTPPGPPKLAHPLSPFTSRSCMTRPRRSRRTRPRRRGQRLVQFQIQRGPAHRRARDRRPHFTKARRAPIDICTATRVTRPRGSPRKLRGPRRRGTRDQPPRTRSTGRHAVRARGRPPRSRTTVLFCDSVVSGRDPPGRWSGEGPPLAQAGSPVFVSCLPLSRLPSSMRVSLSLVRTAASTAWRWRGAHPRHRRVSRLISTRCDHHGRSRRTPLRRGLRER